MAAPGSFTSGQVLTAAEMNALPGAVVGYDQNTAPNTTPGSLTTSTQNYETVTFTAVTGRLYLAIASLNASAFDAAGALFIEISDGTDSVARASYAIPNTTQDFVGGTASGYFTATGSTNVTLQAYVAAGATSATVADSSRRDPFLIVLDVGPS